jgi:hypothetical protein
MKNVAISRFQGTRMFPKQKIICLLENINSTFKIPKLISAEHPATH